MKFWTFQNKYTLDMIIENGIYYPDFLTSNKRGNKTPLAYDFIKKAYEKNNDTMIKGVVFGLTSYNSLPILTYNDYKNVIIESSMLGLSSDDDNTYILELEIDETEVDLTSCQFLNFMNLVYNLDMDSKFSDYKYSQLLYRDIFNCDNKFLDLMQSHIHYIDKSMIKGIYRSFSYNKYFNYEYYYGTCIDLEYYRKKLLDKK